MFWLQEISFIAERYTPQPVPLLVHRRMSLGKLPASGIRGANGRLVPAGMNIAHPDRLAKLHLRAGMVSVDRNLLDLAVHRGEIQVRAPVQVLLDAGADGILIVHLLGASGCESTQQCQQANQVPSIHLLGFLFPLCDIVPRNRPRRSPNQLSLESVRPEAISADENYRECNLTFI
jgi:hypothetical protein